MRFPRQPQLDSAALAALWRPYVESAIDLFGAERCMFESNLPLDRTGSSQVACNAYKLITSGCSPADRQAIFGATANRVYCLGLPGLI